MKTLFCSHILTDAISLMERRGTRCLREKNKITMSFSYVHFLSRDKIICWNSGKWVGTTNEIYDVAAVRSRGRSNYDRGYILCILKSVNHDSVWSNCIRKTLKNQHVATITQRSNLVREWPRCANDVNRIRVTYGRGLFEPSLRYMIVLKDLLSTKL
jgi:hypothetical protein